MTSPPSLAVNHDAVTPGLGDLFVRSLLLAGILDSRKIATLVLALSLPVRIGLLGAGAVEVEVGRCCE